MNANNTHQQHMDGTIRLPDGAELQYAPVLTDYEQYPTATLAGAYANSIYITKTPASGVGVAGVNQAASCSYQSEHNTCNSSQELNVSGLPDHHTLVPTTVRYMQASQYDDMQEYGLSAADAANCVVPMESHYADDVAAVAYGYVSETNYELPGGSSVNTVSYSPRPLMFDDNLNGADETAARLAAVSGGVGGPTVAYDAHQVAEFQQKMSQLTLNPMDMVTQLRVAKDELINGSGSDICSTMRWRAPNLSEVISFLNNPNNAIKANAAAYLQHLCYMDDTNKQRTRTLGGIPPLIRLLSYDVPEIHK